MSLFDFTLFDPAEPMLVQDDVCLRLPRREDYPAWARLRAESRDHLQPFEPDWLPDELSLDNWKRRLKVYARDMRNNVARPWLVFKADDQTLIGGCVMSQIRRGPAMTATIGYWIGKPYIQQGYATNAVKAALHYAFDKLDLHRMEAACLPENIGSQGVLRNCGFEEEGRAPEYLHINGARREHILFAVSRKKFRRLVDEK